MRIWIPSLLMALLLTVVGCSNKGGGVNYFTPPANGPVGTALPTLLTTLAVPNLVANKEFSFDIGFVEPSTGWYYLADRNNASVDIFNGKTLGLQFQVGGFAGLKPKTANSGPDGVVGIPGTSIVYAGDVNSVKVIDAANGVVTKTIAITKSGFRTDEGCYDPDDQVMMFANPNDATPFATFISTKTQSVIATLPFTASAGLEQCVYDPAQKKFLINNDGNPTNPVGEVDVISAASVNAGIPQYTAVYPLTNCSPTGMALGPNEALLIGCANQDGLPLLTLIMNAANGNTLATITQVGGEDQVAYDPFANRFYTASRQWTANGQTGQPFTPVLGVIDANSLSWIGNVPTGPNAHSVAADPNTGRIYVPISATAVAPGGIQVFKSPNGS